MLDIVDNMPRLKIKRILQDIIEKDLGLLLNVEQTQTGFSESVMCWITGMNETYTRVSGSKNAMQADCTIELQLFSTIHETGVHKGICDILKIQSDHPRFKDLGFSIRDITPVASQSIYDQDATDGGIIGTVSLKFSYLARF